MVTLSSLTVFIYLPMGRAYQIKWSKWHNAGFAVKSLSWLQKCKKWTKPFLWSSNQNIIATLWTAQSLFLPSSLAQQSPECGQYATRFPVITLTVGAERNPSSLMVSEHGSYLPRFVDVWTLLRVDLGWLRFSIREYLATSTERHEKQGGDIICYKHITSDVRSDYTVS